MNTYEKNRTETVNAAECAADYVLADYEGDIKKILSASAKAVPSGHFTDGNRERFGGIVTFDVLYVDADGKLTSLHTTKDYEIGVYADEEKTKDAKALVTVSAVNARPSGPRKLNLRANLCLTADILEEDVLPFSPDGEYEALTASVPVREVKTLETAEREYAEKSDPLPNLSGGEVLIAGGDVFAERAEKTADGVRVSGKIYLFALLRAEDGTLFDVKKTVPFDELLRQKEIPDDADVFADGIVTSVSATPMTEEEENYLSFSCLCEYRTSIEKNAEIPVTLDLYHGEYETALTFSEFRGEKLLFAENGSVSASGQAKIPEECFGTSEILYSSATAKIKETEWRENGFAVKGDVTVNYVGTQTDKEGKPTYCHGKVNVPFEKTYGKIQNGENKKVDAVCYAYRSEVKIDGEKIAANALVALSVRVTEPTACQVVTSAEMEKDTPVLHDKNRLTVYFPEKGETVYSIAKVFHVPADAIAKNNALVQAASTADETPLPKRLLIKE